MCRRDAYQLAGGILAPPIWDIYRDEYWDRCLNPENYSYDIAEGTEKGFFHDFESGEVGKLPSGWKRTVGEITVQNDPYNPNNKVLEIKTVPGEATKTSASFSGGRDFDKLTLEFKMMVYEASSGAFFYNDVGQAIQWCIVGSSNFAKITNRQSASGTGEDCALLDLETWHDVKIVYEPNGKAASRIQFYVDGYLEKESGRYYGIDSGAAIPTSIDSIVFTSFLAGEGTIYLDDVRVTVE